MLQKKVKMLALVLLMATLFCGLSTVAFAASYELTRIELCDFYDDSDYVRINTDDIDDEMEQNVSWKRTIIRPTISKGTVKISGSDVDTNSEDEYYVMLDEGETTKVTIRIYDSSDTKKATYYLEITRGGTGLEKVVFTGDDYDKTITTIDEENELLIPMSESELRLKVYPENDDYTVECNGSTSKKNTWDITVPKSKTVTVELILYNENDREVATYSFDITRSTKAEASSSKLDLLDDLTVEANDEEYDLFPDFDVDTQEYYVCFPSSVRTAVIIPTLGSDGESVKVNNKTVVSGKESRTLDVTSSGSSYTVRITDENDDTHDYTVHFIRSSRTSGDSASIEKLKVKRGASKSNMEEIGLDPDFEEYTTSYELTCGADSAYFSFRAQLNDSDSMALLSTDDGVTQLEYNTYSTAIQLEGDTEAVIRVYSPSFEEYKDYKFEISGRALDDNAYLEDLDVYVDGVKVAVSPEFDSKTYAYTLSVGKDADVFKVKATAEESTSTITVMGDDADSGKLTDEYSIGTSFTNVPIVVVAEDGSSNTYRLTITRSATGSTVADTTDTDDEDKNTTTGTNKVEINKDMRVVLRVGSMTYLANGTSKTLPAAPYITSSRTQVPLRVIAEALGAGVNYNAEAKQITINLGTERLYMDIGRTIKDFDVAPEVKANTTFVPVRYVSEKMGLKCTYNNGSKEVVITYDSGEDDE